MQKKLSKIIDSLNFNHLRLHHLAHTKIQCHYHYLRYYMGNASGRLYRELADKTQNLSDSMVARRLQLVGAPCKTQCFLKLFDHTTDLKHQILKLSTLSRLFQSNTLSIASWEQVIANQNMDKRKSYKHKIKQIPNHGPWRDRCSLFKSQIAAFKRP